MEVASVKRMPHVALPKGSETRRFLDRQDPARVLTPEIHHAVRAICGITMATKGGGGDIEPINLYVGITSLACELRIAKEGEL